MKDNQIISLVLYAGSLILLLEWVYPLDDVTDTANMSAFYLFMVLCFILTATKLPYWIVSPIKFMGLLFVMHQLFYSGSFLSRIWINEVFTDMQMNISMMLSQNWGGLSPSFRTLLFLILLWMMSYLLYYWFAVRKKPFSFILFTFIYITVLDTFTVFNAEGAIIRAFIIGVAIMGIAHLQHLLEKEKIKMPQMSTMMKWISPLLILIGFSTVVGYAAPKYEPIWPDPVPFIQSAAEGSGIGDGPGGGVQKIGYGENDERLGGGFIQDDTTVFLAQSPKSKYWKVETKEVYTGKGWIRSNDGVFNQSNSSLRDLAQYSDLVERSEDEATVRFESPGVLNKLVYNYGADRVTSNHDGMTFEVNSFTGEVVPKSGDSTNLPKEYQLDVQRPFYPVEEMRKIDSSVEDNIGVEYLQLPESLPDRVVRLAEEIVDGEDNRYDQAKAIEQYFTNNGFRYETQDVAVPSEDEDYVDQFLFESQAGYCDNFSTSMVVMLRALDIPARWAKGFTGGERVFGEDHFEGGEPEYEVTNNNAHSWVEVYFPNLGWVPFEPTVGFNNPTNFSFGESVDDILDRESQETPETPELPEDSESDEEDDTEEEEEDNSGTVLSFSKPMQFTAIGLSVAILAVLVWLIIKKRFSLIRRWKQQKMARNHDVDTFTDGYQFILKVLAKHGLVFKEGQTLREFAIDVDRWYGHSAMSELTRYYERAIYRDEPIQDQHHEVYRLWNRLVNDLLA